MVVLVSGGANGIGKSIALSYAKNGYDVAISYRSSIEQAKSVLKEIESFGVKGAIFKADLSKYQDVKNLFKQVENKFNRLDVYVNNAGVTKKSAFLDTTEQDFDEIVNVDFKGAYFCMQNAAKLMIKKAIKGSIIAISSNNAIAHFADVSVYGSVKTALNKMVEHISLELAGYNIRVNAVCPGWTDTGATRLDKKEETYYKIPLQKWVEPQEIADACLFLSSESARSITGTAIVIDNGAVNLSDKRERYGF